MEVQFVVDRALDAGAVSLDAENAFQSGDAAHR
jgi:hypothetical protein